MTSLWFVSEAVQPELTRAAPIVIRSATAIPDPAQFSALVADAAQPNRAGSLMSFQTTPDFTPTSFTETAAPFAAVALGWPTTPARRACGPVVGVEATRRLIRLGRSAM